MRDFLEIIDKQGRRTRASIAIICFILGFLLVTQIKGQMAAEKPLQDESEKNLVEIARDLGGEVTSLKAEAATLDLQLYKAGRLSDDQKSVLAESKKTKSAIEIAAVTTPVEGRGVRVTLADNKDKLSGVDLADVVNELRAAGAEAIVINGRRIGTESYFIRKDGDMFVDGRKIAKPFVFEAIGDQETIRQALTMTGGIRDTLNASVPGVEFKISSERKLVLPARESYDFNHAKAVVGK